MWIRLDRLDEAESTGGNGDCRGFAESADFLPAQAISHIPISRQMGRELHGAVPWVHPAGIEEHDEMAVWRDFNVLVEDIPFNLER